MVQQVTVCFFFAGQRARLQNTKKGQGKKDKKCERAMFFGNSGEHGPHAAKCQSSDLSDKSDISGRRRLPWRYAAASHVFWKLRGTWLSLHPVPQSDKSDKSDKSDILCPQYRLCAMYFASQQNTQPCAIEIPKRMAHRLP